MACWTSLVGSARYEFAMQVRRRAVWAVTAALMLLLLRVTWGQWGRLGAGVVSWRDTVLLWTQITQYFLPVGFGVLLADRWVRDDHLRVAELLETLPSGEGVRLAGKYVGGLLAGALPLAIGYFVGIGAIAWRVAAPGAVALGGAAFAVVVVPGLVLVAAFSLACPTVMPVPLYQFLFAGYWYWGNLLTPALGIPTLSQTVLTPAGNFRLYGFFGLPTGFGVRAASTYTLGAALASLALMLTVPVLPLVVAWALRRRAQARA